MAHPISDALVGMTPEGLAAYKADYGSTTPSAQFPLGDF
jgi:hypothetical protein